MEDRTMNLSPMHNRVYNQMHADMRKAFVDAAWSALAPLFDAHKLRGVGTYWDDIERTLHFAADAAAKNSVRAMEVEIENAAIAAMRQRVNGGRS
jgi:hypothetical protein